jgi:hypothetical protein
VARVEAKKNMEKGPLSSFKGIEMGKGPPERQRRL